MTTKDLEKIAIVDISSKAYPRVFDVPNVGEIKIPEYYSIEDIYESIYNIGVLHGITQGKQEKIKEFKKVLDID